MIGSVVGGVRLCAHGLNQGGSMRNPNQPIRLESIEQVMERITRRRSWIYSAVRRGDFPQPVRLSTRCTRWDSREVDRWIEQRLQGAVK